MKPVVAAMFVLSLFGVQSHCLAQSSVPADQGYFEHPGVFTQKALDDAAWRNRTSCFNPDPNDATCHPDAFIHGWTASTYDDLDKHGRFAFMVDGKEIVSIDEKTLHVELKHIPPDRASKVFWNAVANSIGQAPFFDKDGKRILTRRAIAARPANGEK